MQNSINNKTDEMQLLIQNTSRCHNNMRDKTQSILDILSEASLVSLSQDPISMSRVFKMKKKIVKNNLIFYRN